MCPIKSVCECQKRCEHTCQCQMTLKTPQHLVSKTEHVRLRIWLKQRWRWQGPKKERGRKIESDKYEQEGIYQKEINRGGQDGLHIRQGVRVSGFHGREEHNTFVAHGNVTMHRERGNLRRVQGKVMA